jgi:two-component system sensor histidine kinase RegB
MAGDTRPTAPAWYLDAAPASVSAWVVRLQWTRCAVDAVVLIAAFVISSEEFPLRRLAPLVAAVALFRADLAVRLGRGQPPPRLLAAAAIGIDVLLLTGLLELSGGPSNPFAVIYAVQVLLTAATLGGIWAGAMAAWASLCYGVLIAWHLEELVPPHHRLIDFPTHLFTMWLALVVMAELVMHFIREASTAIARRERQLAEMRADAARRERLMSVTTLAAGAAHELSTPLGTIAVACRELERGLTAAAADPSWTSDARLIRQQVERCDTILDQMSGRAGGGMAEVAEATTIEALFADLRHRLPPELADRMQVRVTSPSTSIVIPRAGLLQVLLSLVKNAFDASDHAQPVTVESIERQGSLSLIIRDQGTGLSADVLRRAGEPFYTTKEPGRGFGLGLFLARMFAERCGGTLTLQSAGSTDDDTDGGTGGGTGGGTVAILELPLAPEAAEVR